MFESRAHQRTRTPSVWEAGYRRATGGRRRAAWRQAGPRAANPHEIRVIRPSRDIEAAGGSTLPRPCFTTNAGRFACRMPCEVESARVIPRGRMQARDAGPGRDAGLQAGRTEIHCGERRNPAGRATP